MTHQAGPTSKETANEDKSNTKTLPKVTEVSNNISFLVNQNDLISNVLSVYHSKGKLQGTILDFTIRQFRYLYLLYAKSIVILDFKDLLRFNQNATADISIVESIQLTQSPS